MDALAYYALLEVSENATYQEIKRSYRRLARKYHPDRNDSSFAVEMIKKINQAFETLSDRDKRRAYDSETHFHDSEGEIPKQQTDTTVDYSNRNVKTIINSSIHSKPSDGSYFGAMLDIPRGRFHIVIEPSLCLAFGGCESIAPRVFTVDKNKRINPKAKVRSETGEDLDRIILAAQACPTKAIKIIDRYNGEQLYP